MGVWSKFLGYAAVNAFSEAQRETKKHNELCYQLSDYQEDIDKYLKSINCDEIYIVDWSSVERGNISTEKEKIDRLKKNIEEYIKLGGNIKCINSLDYVDREIQKVKYLRSIGQLDRQTEFIYNDVNEIKEFLDNEKNSFLEQGKRCILNCHSNELKDVINEEFQKQKMVNEVVIDFAKVLPPDVVEEILKTNELDFDIDLLTLIIVLEPDEIRFYDWVTNTKMYYRSKLKPYVHTLVEYKTFDDGSCALVSFVGLNLFMRVQDAEILKNYFYDSHISECSDINSLSGIDFENLCEKLIQNMGFKTKTTKASGDGGIDLIAYNNQPLLSGKYIIQCKRYTGSVGEPIIRDLYGVVTSERANKGILMTTGYFTKSAITFADGKPLELIDGIKLKELLNKYAINEFDNTEVKVNITLRDVFMNNAMLEYYYDRFRNTISELDVVDNEQKRAQFINWLVSLSMGELPVITDLKEKVVIFKEIKSQIKQYINNSRIEKSKLLAYLYQMTYVQLSILEGDFNDAKNMFKQLMEHKELRLSVFETIKETPDEVHITDFLFDHQGIFTWLCYTWYNMIQVSILVDDSLYKSYLTDHNLFYGLPVLETARLEATISEIESGIRTTGNINYFNERLNGIKEIDSLVNDEIPIRQMFFIEFYDLDVYYKYTYENGDYTDFAPTFYKIFLDNDCLKIEGIGGIKKIESKKNEWNRIAE